MNIPTLSEFPSPPVGKSGWPWTADKIKPTGKIYGNRHWPKISIVTPSYNQGQFLEQTIRSVLLQGYPNIEYIIIDGGSVDNSVEIIKRYESWLTYWISKPDRGQSHALNEGFGKATGEIFGWLNADDYFHPEGLATLIELRRNHPDSVAWVGACLEIDIHGNPIQWVPPRTGNKPQIGDWGTGAHFYQPSCLFSAELFFKAGQLDEQLNYVMDIDLWLRLADSGYFTSIDKVVSYSRNYPEAKTFRDLPMREAEMVFINFRRGTPQMARQRMLRWNKIVLDFLPYRDLLRYIMKRTARRLCQGIRDISGKHKKPTGLSL